MSSGNWGPELVDHVRSRRSWRIRVALTLASIVAGVVLVKLALQLGSGRPAEVAVVVVLLGLGIVFGLRPWARE